MRNRLIAVLALMAAWGGATLAQEENSIRKPEVPAEDSAAARVSETLEDELLESLFWAGSKKVSLATTFLKAMAAGEAEPLKRVIAGRSKDDLNWLLQVAARSSAGSPEAAIGAIDLLVAAGGDLNARGFTPLHEAARVGSLETAEYLIGKGANVNSRVWIVGALDPFYDFADDTPVDVAAALRHSELVKLLRQHGGKTATELEANRLKSITWGKPVDGLQLGVAVAIEENTADRHPTYLEAYVRNSGTEPRTFLASVHTGVDGGPERTSLLVSRLKLYKLGGGDLITLYYQGENLLLRRDKNRQSSEPEPSALSKDGSLYTIAALSVEDARQRSITLAPGQQIGPVSIRYGDASKWAPPRNKARPDRKSQYGVVVTLDINHPQSAWKGALETAPLPRLRFNPHAEKEVLWKRGASNAGYQHLGCAKTFALIGRAFAEANLKLEAR